MMDLANLPYYKEYGLISQYYGDRRANRSGVLLMDHINEGVALLRWHLNAPLAAQLAFCLHPIFQDDDTYFKFNPMGCNAEAVGLATEYRRTANAYLPKHAPRIPQLSYHRDVNTMLIADKIHNRWQFEKHLQGKIENSDRLDQYFKEWFMALNIYDDMYINLSSELDKGSSNV
jgi:hypothetical protein